METIVRMLNGAIKTLLSVLAGLGLTGGDISIQLHDPSTYKLIGIVLLLKAICDLLHIRIQVVKNGRRSDLG